MKNTTSIVATMTVAVMALAPAHAQFENARTACSKTGDERVIEIVSPGSVGDLCDVRYTYVTANTVKVPYHANNNASYCQMKAKDIVADLTSRGYSCAVTSQQAQAPADASTVVVEGPSSAAPRRQAEARFAAPRTEAPVAETPVAETRAAEAPGIRSTAVDELTVKLNDVLDTPEETTPPEPVRHSAVRGPESLVANAEPIVSAGTSGDSRRVVGRLVGAEPTDEPAPRTELRAPQSSTSATKVTRVTPVTKASVSTGRPVSTASVVAREPADIIRATLNAQLAAWNEGDLDAFMETYWKNDDLKFVSGTKVTRGWSSTMKSYRSRYGDGDDLGQLGLDDVDVQIVTADVAVITGRFQHASAEASSGGVFSLVMKRHDGVWRIVHDHTTPDLTTGE